MLTVVDQLGCAASVLQTDDPCKMIVEDMQGEAVDELSVLRKKEMAESHAFQMAESGLVSVIEDERTDLEEEETNARYAFEIPCSVR